MSSVEAIELRKWFPAGGGGLIRRAKSFVKAVDGVSFRIRPGEIHGLVGESGSGKTTTGKLVAGLIEPTSGAVIIDGADIRAKSSSEVKEMRRQVQYVFQDPYSALDDRLKVRKIMSDPLGIFKIRATDEDLVRALERCGLTPGRDILEKYPRQLSGGQRQRLCLARILLLQPKVIIADEIVSMLDVSTRIGILDLISELRREEGLTCIFITHDIISAQYLCDSVSVMYLGKIVESGVATDVVLRPAHPYTKLLMASIPHLQSRELPEMVGEPPDAMHVPPGCAFNPRCKYATEHCRQEAPLLQEYLPGHFAACHYVREINRRQTN